MEFWKFTLLCKKNPILQNKITRKMGIIALGPECYELEKKTEIFKNIFEHLYLSKQFVTLTQMFPNFDTNFKGQVS